MPKLDHAVSAVLPLLSKETTDPKELKDVITRLFREGVDLEALIAFILERGHERQRQDLPELTTVDDLKGFLRSLREPSPANRKRWQARFKSGQAIYLCPQCEYAGTDDFKTPDDANVLCGVCGCFKDKRYFTRTWSADEQATYEAEQERLIPIRRAQEEREREKRQRILELEPTVDEVLKGFDGVLDDYVDECEERSEAAPFVRTVVNQTAVPTETIISEWAEHQRSHKVFAQFTRMSVHEFAARSILKEYSMREAIDHLDEFVPFELDALQAGEQRFFFTRDELIHEFTVNVTKWVALMDVHDLSTGLGMDGLFAVTLREKGWAATHPCLCDDCKQMREGVA
jgi:hypothetical protein